MSPDMPQHSAVLRKKRLPTLPRPRKKRIGLRGNMGQCRRLPAVCDRLQDTDGEYECHVSGGKRKTISGIDAEKPRLAGRLEAAGKIRRIQKELFSSLTRRNSPYRGLITSFFFHPYLRINKTTGAQ